MRPLRQANPNAGQGKGALRPGATAFLLGVLIGALSSPPLAIGQDAPLRAGADVEKPRKTTHVDPRYPEGARVAHVEQVVVVGFTVDVRGRVTDPAVLSGHVLLDEAALAAVRQWRYKPTRVDGRNVSVRMVGIVPFWLGQAGRPQGWPLGSSAGNETWITWPNGEGRSRLELLELDSEELPSPSTLRVYRGAVRNRSKKPLRNVLAVAAFRNSLNAPPEAIVQEIGDLEPGAERPFELRPSGHQVDIAFGQIVDGEMKPLPTRRQVKSMTRVLPSRPIREDRTHACLVPGAQPTLDGRDPAPGADPETGAEPDEGADRPPKLRILTKPEYGQPALNAAMEGTVLVEIRIGRTGHVDCARILRSLPGTGFDEEALRIVYEWRFEPALRKGQPVSAVAHAPVAFRIY